MATGRDWSILSAFQNAGADQPAQPFAFLSLFALIVAGAAVTTLTLQLWDDDLMHESYASSRLISTQIKELCAMDLQRLERLLPLS